MFYDYRTILSRREIYDQSLKELQLTVDELERRSAGIGEESKIEVTSCCFYVVTSFERFVARQRVEDAIRDASGDEPAAGEAGYPAAGQDRRRAQHPQRQ